MQMFPHLRAVEDLEPLPLSEAEVILGPGFIVVKGHKQSHPCRDNNVTFWWLELAEVNCLDAVLCWDSHCGCYVAFVHLFPTWASGLCYAMAIEITALFIYFLQPICCFYFNS